MAPKALNATPEPHVHPELGELHLGKEAAKKDPRTLKLARYIKKGALPAPPGRVERAELVSAWPMYANDRLPNCTTAAAGHMVEEWTATKGALVTPAEADVLKMFDATGPQNEGRFELDILNYWRKTGLGGDKITAFVSIDPKNELHMQIAIWLFGGVYAGLALPITAQAQTGPDRVWNTGRGANGQPGTWGGHAVPITDYVRSRKRLRCVTWGFVQTMTFGFWARYGDEGYAIISPDWLNAAHESPVPGFNLAKLLDDLAQIDAG